MSLHLLTAVQVESSDFPNTQPPIGQLLLRDAHFQRLAVEAEAKVDDLLGGEQLRLVELDGKPRQGQARGA